MLMRPGRHIMNINLHRRARFDGQLRETFTVLIRGDPETKMFFLFFTAG